MQRPKKAAKKKQARSAPRPVRDPRRDSEDIERAVYDGMVDLRQKKPG